jgi:biotin-(acetyl-CoA carboxylase) ligase
MVDLRAGGDAVSAASPPLEHQRDVIPNPQKQTAKVTEEQTTARGTEENQFVSVPLALICSSVPNAFPDSV